MESNGEYTAETPTSSVESATAEVEQYKMFKPSSPDSNPLKWWKLHENQFPLLARVAKKILCVPATSVPSERVFSTAGDIVTASRANLKWYHVDKMIFLKHNMK